MKMDLEPIEAAHPVVILQPAASESMHFAPIRAVAVMIFLLMIPLLMVPYWLVLGVGMALASAINLIRGTIVYGMDVTIGRGVREIL